MSVYPKEGTLWRELKTGRNTLVVSKGGERPWPIAWIQILVDENGLYWGYEAGTSHVMRDWFEAFEYVGDRFVPHVLSFLDIVESYEANGEDCTDLRVKLGLPAYKKG